MKCVRAFLAISSLCALGSCADDTDYVRVILRSSDTTIASSQLKLQVFLSGGEKRSDFSYDLQPKGLAPASPDLTDFTISFPKGAPSEVDVRVVASGQPNQFGGDLRVTLPGAQRTIPLALSRAESTPILDVRPLDSDTQSIAAGGQDVALAWPSTQGGVKTFAVPLDRVEAGVSRELPEGRLPTKVRVTSRPSTTFPSDLYVTSWIDENIQPVLLTVVRNAGQEKRANIDKLRGITDLHVAVDPRTSSAAPIVSAALAENRVVLYAHDVDGNLKAGPIESDALTPITGLVGIAVTSNETVTLVVKGNPGRLIQVSLKPETLGVRVGGQDLAGTPVAMSLSADLSRILVALVKNPGDRESGTLELQAFSAADPKPSSEPAFVARYPFVIGDPAGRVALSSCAIAWPERRRDGSNVTDVWFSPLDFEQRPTGEPHVVNVSQDGHHWAPSLACFNPSRIVATVYSGPNPRGDSATLAIRELPSR